MASSYSIEYKLLRFALPSILITCNLIDYQAPNIVVKWECKLKFPGKHSDCGTSPENA